MNSILDLGKRGSEKVGDLTAPTPQVSNPELIDRLVVIKTFPYETFDVNTADGVKKDVKVHAMLLNNLKIFSLLWSIAPFEPMVFARQNGRTVEGMLSPNYDAEGLNREPTLKVIALRQAYPLTASKLPDARMGTMLSGAANSEAKGSGGHSGPVASDFEHRLTLYGAISLDDESVSLTHKNHTERQTSSVATGLTNGNIGSLYVPDKSLSDFPGYGEPMIFRHNQLADDDAIFIPDSFLESETAFGAYYVEASHLMMGAGLEALYQRKGDGVRRTIETLSIKLGKEIYVG